MLWLFMAIGSAFFAGVTSILAKCGIKKTNSDVATAVRTIVVLVFAWVMVFIVGSQSSLQTITVRSFIFLGLSGLATGASWLCYFKALSIGNINKVVPIDKSSTILTVILAIIFFQETNHLVVKLICTLGLSIGIYLMVEKKDTIQGKEGKSWWIFAVLSAIFAAATSILSKIGMSDVESNLGTALRTMVVLLMAWLVVFVKGNQSQVKHIEKKELLFILLSGLATGASWLCYYYALQNGVVSIVVPIDKMSILVTILFSFVVFKEKLSVKAMIGLGFMVTSTICMAIFG